VATAATITTHAVTSLCFFRIALSALQTRFRGLCGTIEEFLWQPAGNLSDFGNNRGQF
jgi:hypothetical protein